MGWSLDDSTLSPAQRESLIALRRDLHRHPELGFAEHRTAGVVARRLRAIGVEVTEGIAGTGVVGHLPPPEPPAPARWIALRADMDALPVQERGDAPYRSVHDGVMHACGHDGHVATLVTAMERLAEAPAELAGGVVAIFQPAEEGLGGARRMIDEGVLRDPPVEAAFGLHYWSRFPTGTIGVAAGATMASVDEFRLTIEGRSGHAAMPHQTTDALVASAALVGALQTIVSRRVDPLHAAVVTVGELHAGTAFNVIAGEATLRGTVRAFDPELWERLPGWFEEIVAGVCAAHGCRYTLDYRRIDAPLVNDAEMAALVREVAVSLVGADHVVEERTMGGEDMGEFLAAVPGCFAFVGARSEAKGITAPQHHPEFDLDEDALSLGVELLVGVARRALGGRSAEQQRP